MDDMTNNSTGTEVAPQDNGAPIEQGAAPDPAATSDQEIPTDNGDDTGAVDDQPRLFAGKFKSPEDMEKAYQELERSYHQERQARSQEREQQAPEQQTPPSQGYEIPAVKVDDLPFDEDTLKGLDTYFQRRMEAERTTQSLQTETQKVEKFFEGHREELVSDPVLRGTIQTLIKDANSQGQYLDHEDAYNQAKNLLNQRVKPMADQARTEGVEEGKELTKTKQQLGGVGPTNKSQPQPNEDDMSFDEYVKYHNIPRRD